MVRTGIPEEPGEEMALGVSVEETVGLSVGNGVAVVNGVAVGTGVAVGVGEDESPRPGVGPGLSTNASPPAGKRSREWPSETPDK